MELERLFEIERALYECRLSSSTCTQYCQRNFAGAMAVLVLLGVIVN